ncbi:ketosteroid isomerase-like protein [Pedobacter sp. W3I1]|uniref:nuclear transport factor 2 family protein n=1 Tax=Pedobacter sp. W3I1 TaxID=3042291 RepID=UPI002788EB0C|nr:nuclear transport factor 2 family protein [Pedobacter sp. W3I1]MDQ0640934.1 ketosteroid isomerase-like protein [Pedobacter sp. W3I1]
MLESAKAAIAKGDYEGFLSYCTEDTVWNFIGEQVLNGKDAVRKYMDEVYAEPPKFRVENLITEGDFVVAVGKINLKNKEGNSVDYAYCDVWRLRDGKLHDLKAFVVEEPSA